MKQVQDENQDSLYLGYETSDEESDQVQDELFDDNALVDDKLTTAKTDMEDLTESVAMSKEDLKQIELDAAQALKEENASNPDMIPSFIINARSKYRFAWDVIIILFAI